MDRADPRPRRTRHLLSAAFLALLALASAHACGGGAGGAERAFSVQLHLHGSFSEGEGSIDSHDWEACDLGCDVIWWSDHDFRIATYEHASRYGFEDWLEPLARGEPWTSRIKKYVGDRKGIKPLTRGGPEQSAAFTAERAHEGQRSLRASTRGAGPAFEPLLFGF